MPPKKKARKSSTKEPDEPLEYVAHIRETSGKRFAATGRRKNVNYDIEQNVREIRALLKINGEIFGRCMSSASNYPHGKSALFTRHGFDVVKVRQNQTKTQFITEGERSQQTFDMKPLSELPAGLDDVFVAKYQAEPFNGFIDYDAFFQSAIMLHDDILEPFLAKLKCHIESIHVCLGKIESWLLEPNSNIEFLEATFGKKLEIQTVDDFEVCACPAGTHGSSDLCLLCSRNYGSHAYLGYSDGNKYRCRSGATQAFVCKKIHLLRSCNESGKFEKTFAIAKQGDQTKLKKFLEFMES